MRIGNPFKLALIIRFNKDDILLPRFWIVVAFRGKYWGITYKAPTIEE